MRPFFYTLLSLLIPFMSFAQQPLKQKKAAKSSRTYTVRGRVTETWNYCGGARPTDEMLEQMRTPVAAANKTFYIRAGNKNSNTAQLVKVTTNDSGYFSLKLGAGTYCIINKWQTVAPAYGKIIGNNSYEYKGDDCLRGAWAHCFQQFVVKSSTVVVNFNYHHECFANEDNPCMQYIGPYPP